MQKLGVWNPVKLVPSIEQITDSNLFFYGKIVITVRISATLTFFSSKLTPRMELNASTTTSSVHSLIVSTLDLASIIYKEKFRIRISFFEFEKNPKKSSPLQAIFLCKSISSSYTHNCLVSTFREVCLDILLLPFIRL